MTSKAAIPGFPNFDGIIDDSPTCHQSLKYWGGKAAEVGSTVHQVASGLHHYHETGTQHQKAGSALSEVLSNAAKVFKTDDVLQEPLTKFADAFNRIECYQDMLLTQTQMLGVEPLMKMATDVEKMKKCKLKLTKASESLHISWAKYASMPHVSHLQEPQLLDRTAHQVITSRQKYQLLLAEYTEKVRNTNTQKKVFLLQRVLEHMLAEFSFFNYCSQILKELEPYMNNVFEDVQAKLAECEKMAALDELNLMKLEEQIDTNAHMERLAFPAGDQWPSAVHSTGRFFNKVGGMISSGVKDLKRGPKDDKDGVNKENEPDWELIDTPPRKESSDDLNDENLIRTSSTASHFFVSVNDNGENAQPSTTQSGGSQSIKTTDTNNDDKSVKQPTETDGSLIKTNKVSPIHETHKEDGFYKKGYLRIKQKAFPKSKYPLLYFILDKQYGELLSQGQDQEQPQTFAKLMLSTVKPCDLNESDRNYCFQLVTNDADHILQARNETEQQEWMSAIQNGIATALGSHQDRKRANARGRSLKEHQVQRKDTTCHNAVERIKAIEGNSHCADCGCPRPGWASSNIGVVICIECSGVHRSLGVHISKVKSLSLDRWENHLVEYMEANGNTKVNRLYEANLDQRLKISRESTKTERLNFITKKYVERLFFSTAQTVDDEENDDGISVNELKDGIKDENEDGSSDDMLRQESFEDNNDRNNDVNASVLCLVKDCEDCKAGIHGGTPQQSDNEAPIETNSVKNEELEPESVL